MDLEKFLKIADSIKEDLKKVRRKGHISVYDNPVLYAKIENLVALSQKVLSQHKTFMNASWERLEDFEEMPIREITSMVDYIIEIAELEKVTESKTEQMKIFESANEKIKQAVSSFKKEDYTSAINNLNTALELVLKDKLEIPTTITKINTARIIDICIKNKIGPYVYFSEAKKHICSIDNKIKHQGYSPSKIDCINAIKSTEELVSKLRERKIKLNEDSRNKIYAGI